MPDVLYIKYESASDWKSDKEGKCERWEKGTLTLDLVTWSKIELTI